MLRVAIRIRKEKWTLKGTNFNILISRRIAHCYKKTDFRSEFHVARNDHDGKDDGNVAKQKDFVSSALQYI